MADIVLSEPFTREIIMVLRESISNETNVQRGKRRLSMLNQLMLGLDKSAPIVEKPSRSPIIPVMNVDQICRLLDEKVISTPIGHAALDWLNGDNHDIKPKIVEHAIRLIKEKMIF